MSQIKQTFKAGDKVYFPNWSNKIFVLKTHEASAFPLMVTDNKIIRTLTLKGKEQHDDYLPVIFHATKENHKKLTELYDIQFEEPKSFLDTHLEKGSKVLCLIIKNLPTELPKYVWEINPNQCTVNVITDKREGTYYNQYNKIVLQDIYPIAISSNGKITYLD